MNKSVHFRYIDIYSIFIMILLFVFTIALTTFFFFLGSFCYVIGFLFLLLFISKINHIVLFDNKFILVKYLILFKWISIEDVKLVKCENTGFGSSKNVVIYIYYKDSNKLKKSIFLNFRISGYKKKICAFLNTIDGIIDIDETSLVILGLTKKEGIFKD
jgi:hypothetical protein